MTSCLAVDNVQIEPEWNLVEQDKKIENEHRTKAGGRYVYKWGSFRKWKFSVEYVNSSFYSIVNSWWGANTQLLFYSSSAAAVYSVQIGNDTKPIGKFNRPYDTLFEGTIELETY